MKARVLGLRVYYKRLGEIDLVISHQGLADLTTLSLEKGVRHGAADQQGIDLAHQIAQHFNLVGNFGAANDPDKGLAWVGRPLPQIFHLFLHYPPDRTPPYELRNPP